VDLSALDYLAAAGAAGAAGAINALAGGGTLVSFPTLVGLGVPAVNANVTNTVALVPGYMGASWAQRDDLVPQLDHARALAVLSAAGGLAGSVLLVAIPGHAFRIAVPYLILLSCVLLLGQERVRTIVQPDRGETLGSDGPGPPTGALGGRSAEGPPGVDAGAGAGAVAPETPTSTRREGGPSVRPALMFSVFAAAVYGGFFGAGLGIMLLAILGVFTSESLTTSNALKQALSFVINLVAAIFFAFSGHVQWTLVPVMAAASVTGGVLGGRFVSVVSADLLRRLVVAAGVAVSVVFWVT
jgi:uncharacterized protein